MQKSMDFRALIETSQKRKGRQAWRRCNAC